MDAAAWDRRYEGAELIWTAEPNRFLVQEVVDLRPGTALDLGAGEGRNAVWLAQQGWRVTAVDFSPVAVEKGRRLAAAHEVDVQWVVADVTGHLPLEHYDLVLLAYLHLPAERNRAVLRRATAAVAPGGTLLVIGHDLDNLTRGYGGPQDPDVLLTPDGVAAGIIGLRVIRADRVEREVVTEDGSRIAVDTLVRAVRDAGAD